MMKSTIITLGSLLFCLAAAQPHKAHQKLHHKREVDVVWTTELVVVTAIESLTATVYVNPEGSTLSESIPSITPDAALPAEFFQAATLSSSKSSKTSKSTSTSKPSPSPTPSQASASSPAPVVPAVNVAAAVPSSSSTPVATPTPAPPSTSTAAPSPSTPAPAANTPQSSAVVEAPIVAAVVPTTTQAAAVAAAPTSAAPASSSTPASSGSGNDAGCSEANPCDGTLTYYQAGLGACGITNDGDTDKIVALPVGIMGASSNGNEWCGRDVVITVGTTTITAKIQDKCPSCANNHLDLSNAAFLGLGLTLDQGVGQASWYFP